MQVREQNGLWATVEIEPAGEHACRVRMAVAEDGQPLWSSERDVPLVDADRGAIERTALDATRAIAAHLSRRRRRTRFTVPW